MLKIKDNVDLKELEKYGFEGKKTKYDFNDSFRFTRPNEEYFLFVDNNSYEIQITKRITTDDIDMFVVYVNQTLDNGDVLTQESFLPISRKKGVDFTKYREAFSLYKSDKIVADTVEEPISLS
jgi:hypothetical protein